KSNIFTHITHELRTRLTIILGMVGQIKEDPGRHLDEGLKMIQRNGGKLLGMTNKLLDLSRMEAKMMPVNWVQQDIVAYVKYLVESFHSFAASKQIEISYSIAENHLMMDFDVDKIADIVSNLISNAIKFTPRGGEINVAMFSQNEHGKNYLHLQVKDNGQGIEEEFLPKVFERYFQAQRHEDEYSEGSGLGLAVTRELVQLMNGKISVSSELGKGSVFEVILPITHKAELVSSTVVKDQSVEVANPDSHKQYLEGELTSQDFHEDGRLRLLIVEDSKDVASYLGSLLSVNYKIDNAWNGAEGFELATRYVPDLIISDVMMPVMDGFTLCQRLKNDMRTSHIPIILLTARNEMSARMQGLKAGADAYLGKPFNKEELFIRVDQLIALRQRLRNSYQHLAQDPVIFSSEMEIREKDVPETNSLEYAFMQKVTEILEENLSDEEFGIGNLCDALGMSRSQLYRKFSALTDTSVNVFIQNLRLIKARKLLRSTDLNVSEVAYDTGFKSPSHFSRVYSNKFGVSPSQERRGIVAASN
ncbi:MAG: ATP-binding protein, partial [Lutimonas sp.]